MGYEFDWALPFRSPFLGWLLDGLWITLILTVVSSVGSLLVGVGLALGRRSPSHLVRLASLAFVEVFRGIPTLFWILFLCFVLPTLLGPSAELWLNRWSGLPMAAALAGLIASNGAHVGEIVRSGIQALPRTQETAALSLGLHPARVWSSVLLPQVLRLSLPALGPRMVHNLHNTSLALVVAVPELTWQTQQIETTTFRGFEAITIASIAFVALSLLMTLGFRRLEQRSARWT
jgi:His/Glu/Gln/Arg/opine family amino acid ABC transporter permease subunit